MTVHLYFKLTRDVTEDPSEEAANSVGTRPGMSESVSPQGPGLLPDPKASDHPGADDNSRELLQVKG